MTSIHQTAIDDSIWLVINEFKNIRSVKSICLDNILKIAAIYLYEPGYENYDRLSKLLNAFIDDLELGENKINIVTETAKSLITNTRSNDSTYGEYTHNSSVTSRIEGKLCKAIRLWLIGTPSDLHNCLNYCSEIIATYLTSSDPCSVSYDSVLLSTKLSQYADINYKRIQTRYE